MRTPNRFTRPASFRLSALLPGSGSLVQAKKKSSSMSNLSEKMVCDRKKMNTTSCASEMGFLATILKV